MYESPQVQTLITLVQQLVVDVNASATAAVLKADAALVSAQIDTINGLAKINPLGKGGT